jgi:hypothetical protein
MAKKKTIRVQVPRLQLRESAPVRHPEEDAVAFIGGILLGALIGAVGAIFLAPSDGQTLRRRLSQQLGLGEFEAPEAPVAPVTAGPVESREAPDSSTSGMPVAVGAAV